ncbi:hypothetical protein ACWDNT_25280 [Streptomyces sp. NPDC000963]
MRRGIRKVAVSAVLASAVLIGGTAQTHAATATVGNTDRANTSAAPADREGPAAANIWIYGGNYPSYFAAMAAYATLVGFGMASQYMIEATPYETYDLYYQ